MKKKGLGFNVFSSSTKETGYKKVSINIAHNFDYNIATLRTIAALLIILVHYSGTFLVGYIKRTDMLNVNFWSASYINGACRIATPMFLFISGHFLLRMRRGIWYFYKTRFTNVFIPSLIATGAYILYNYYQLHMDWDRIIHKLKHGYIFGHMWYMYMLIGLYLVTPIIAKILQKMPKEGQIILGLLLMITGVSADSIYYFFEHQSYFKSGRSFLLWFIPYTGYFVLGYAFRDMWFYVFKKRLLILFIIIITANVILNFMSLKFWNYGFYFYSRTSIMVTIGALVFYLFFRQIIINKPNILSKLSGYTLGIYLYHAGLLDYLNRKVFWKYKTGVFLIDILYQYTFTVVLIVLFVVILKKISKFIRINLV